MAVGSHCRRRSDRDDVFAIVRVGPGMAERTRPDRGCRMSTFRLTAAQACVRYIASQYVETDAGEVPYFAGVWAIFGHGNVAGLGEALEAAKEDIPIFRAHNE